MHHRELHRSGDEAAWWRRLNIDPLPVALKLWQQTRSDGEAAATPQDDGGHGRTGAKPQNASSQESPESPDRTARN
jgi:hypothetical protein